MAAGTITAGMFDEEYDIHDRHSSIGVAACFVGAVAACLVVPNPFEGLIWSQALLSLQLPITVFVLIRLTSSRRVMGKYANSRPLNALLVGIGVIVTVLDIVLLTGRDCPDITSQSVTRKAVLNRQINQKGPGREFDRGPWTELCIANRRVSTSYSSTSSNSSGPTPQTGHT